MLSHAMKRHYSKIFSKQISMRKNSSLHICRNGRIDANFSFIIAVFPNTWGGFDCGAWLVFGGLS